MLLSRDFVGHMAKEVVKRLVAGKMIETKDAENLAQQVRQVMADEVTVEDRLNEEAREILSRYSEEMRRTGASYQEMYKKVKSQLARERKLILRLERRRHATEPRKNSSDISPRHRLSRFQPPGGFHRGPRHDPAGNRQYSHVSAEA